MRFKINSLPEGLSQYSFDSSKEGWLNTASVRAVGSDRKVVGPVQLKVGLTQLHPDYYVEGKLRWTLEQNCDRCAEVFQTEVVYPFAQAFAYVSPAEVSQVELNEAGEKAEVILFHAPDLDLNPLVEEQMRLSLPYNNLCRPECKGICQHCGQNLNEGLCDCAEQSKQSPFEVLKKLKVK